MYKDTQQETMVAFIFYDDRFGHDVLYGGVGTYEDEISTHFKTHRRRGSRVIDKVYNGAYGRRWSSATNQELGKGGQMKDD